MNPLDNPIWNSLGSGHASLALETDGVRRFPADYAPFVAVANAGTSAEQGLQHLVQPNETVYLAGIAPEAVTGWSLKSLVPVSQMICRTPLSTTTGFAITEMTARHRPDMMTLTALVYPSFFRTRTPELGRYIGIYQGEQLAAMAGERMRLDGYVEISAVCTHPDFLGRGFAHHLMTSLVNDGLAQNMTSFLHVSHDNVRARATYAHLGFVDRADIALWSLQRTSTG